MAVGEIISLLDIPITRYNRERSRVGALIEQDSLFKVEWKNESN